MQDEEIQGVVEHEMGNRKTDYLFRISVKALILDNMSRVLVVKETGRDFWDLPGGGMDHGESVKDAIARELYEEVSMKGDFSYKPIHVEDPSLLRTTSILQMRLIFHIIPEGMDFVNGQDGDAVMFIDPVRYKDSQHARERQIYEYAQLIN